MFHVTPRALGVYVHWPFCKSKCPYCDFNSHVSEKINVQRWKQAYLQELEWFAKTLPNREVTSIFFGGGTPSLMPSDITEAIIDAIGRHFTLSPEIEITLEANPTSVEAEKFSAFKKAGVNRLSIGVQSLDAASLKFLGREHSSDEALKAVSVAAQYFDNYSFDLMYALPDQTLKSWEKELSRALEYSANHMSLYQLTIEKGTPFYTKYQKGDFTLPDEALAADLYNTTEAMLAKQGLKSYEVSNYAKPSFESKHNLLYWQYGEYMGIGPGAHSRVAAEGGRRAVMMLHGPDKWLTAVEEKGHGVQVDESVSAKEQVEECLLMGLRLNTGINKAYFAELMGKPIESLLSDKLTLLVDEGLLENDVNALRATPKGRLVLNSVVEKLVA
jgi:oxygen-independent coproporphyrinogen-3 oxidase